ncbi:hypothetical protein FG386_002833 [Cryptosporidium ryanae]|uniref:uncharacterized protein n=1 Tax=Cryptosporidium ryanae TaxID=515981 RepID=UPI00351A63F1|nr:hypothetical protein FG386_002833 [Cryptosporidium ryanae]
MRVKGKKKNTDLAVRGNYKSDSYDSINDSLFCKNVLGVISEEETDDYYVLAGDSDKFNIYDIDYILRMPYYEKKYVNFGEPERHKIVHWFSLHSSRLGFQSCTFHLSCRIFDMFLIETSKTLTQCEFGVCAAASFLLASNIIETNSDMIVPTIKQFCDAAKWLNRVKVVEKQIEILATVNKGFWVSNTPLRMLMLYFSRIKNHPLLFGAFRSLIGKEWMSVILDSCIVVCDLILYTALPTTEKGQRMLKLLPPFIMWIVLESFIKNANKTDVKVLKNIFFCDIFPISGLINNEDEEMMYNSAKSIVLNYEKYLSENNCYSEKKVNSSFCSNCEWKYPRKNVSKLLLHRHVEYKPPHFNEQQL